MSKKNYSVARVVTHTQSTIGKCERHNERKNESYANMNVTAFCRYFKKVTGKTYSQALNQIRIGAACRSLINTDLTISQIAYEVGYQSVAYFNRQFRLIKGVTPQEYRLRVFTKHDDSKGMQK